MGFVMPSGLHRTYRAASLALWHQLVPSTIAAAGHRAKPRPRPYHPRAGSSTLPVCGGWIRGHARTYSLAHQRTGDWKSVDGDAGASASRSSADWWNLRSTGTHTSDQDQGPRPENAEGGECAEKSPLLPQRARQKWGTRLSLLLVERRRLGENVVSRPSGLMGTRLSAHRTRPFDFAQGQALARGRDERGTHPVCGNQKIKGLGCLHSPPAFDTVSPPT